ncbi:hypothetical protein V6N13_117433 [Hibiscus sabdariffa]
MNFFVFTGVDSDPSLTWLLAHDAFTEFSKLQATLIPEIGFTKISETFPGWHLQHPASRRSFPELTPPAPGFKEIVSRIGTSNTGLQGDRYTR